MRVVVARYAARLPLIVTGQAPGSDARDRMTSASDGSDPANCVRGEHFVLLLVLTATSKATSPPQSPYVRLSVDQHGIGLKHRWF